MLFSDQQIARNQDHLHRLFYQTPAHRQLQVGRMIRLIKRVKVMVDVSLLPLVREVHRKEEADRPAEETVPEARGLTVLRNDEHAVTAFVIDEGNNAEVKN